MVKVGLSMTVVGSADKIGSWLGNVIHPSESKTVSSKTCPQCQSYVANDAVYCSKCGNKVSES